MRTDGTRDVAWGYKDWDKGRTDETLPVCRAEILD